VRLEQARELDRLGYRNRVSRLSLALGWLDTVGALCFLALCAFAFTPLGPWLVAALVTVTLAASWLRRAYFDLGLPRS
jgi:hypothetical protein